MIEAADALGLIEIEAQDPASRAYRLAHEGLAQMKEELLGSPIELLGEHRVRVRPAEGPSIILETTKDGNVIRSVGGLQQTLLELGPGGGVTFLRDRNQGLEIKVQACTEDGGNYSVRMLVPPMKYQASGSVLFKKASLPQNEEPDLSADGPNGL